MSARARISDRTKLASALLALGWIDYEHAKEMGRENFLSLWHFDHGVLHAIEINNEFWNLTPRLILPHRGKSKKDAGTIAKVKRLARANDDAVRRLLAKEPGASAERPHSRIRSRGFDKTKTRTFSGKVVERKGRRRGLR